MMHHLRQFVFKNTFLVCIFGQNDVGQSICTVIPHFGVLLTVPRQRLSHHHVGNSSPGSCRGVRSSLAPWAFRPERLG